MKTGDTVAWVLVNNDGIVYGDQYKTRAQARRAKASMEAWNIGRQPHEWLRLRIARVVIEK